MSSIVSGPSCSATGSVSTVPDRMSGRCYCKDGYYGPTCQYAAIITNPDSGSPLQCEEHQYLSKEASVGGCINCFCMGIPTGTGPTSCSSSTLFRDKIRPVIEEDDKQFSLVDSNLDTTIPGSELLFNVSNKEITYEKFQQLGDDIFYWSLPSEFLGNKVETLDTFQYTLPISDCNLCSYHPMEATLSLL